MYVWPRTALKTHCTLFLVILYYVSHMIAWRGHRTYAPLPTVSPLTPLTNASEDSVQWPITYQYNTSLQQGEAYKVVVTAINLAGLSGNSSQWLSVRDLVKCTVGAFLMGHFCLAHF